MKKNPILLVMLALLLAFSFSVTGCPEEDDSDSGKSFPADLTPNKGGSAYHKASGAWGDIMSKALIFENWTDGTATVSPFDIAGGLFGASMYDLESIDGKKITVKLDGGDSVILCTSYTITGNKLKISGGAGVFAAFNDVELDKMVD